MSFTFSARSKVNLAEVHDDLARVAQRALELSDIDFAVIAGARDKDEQDHLVAIGASQRRDSLHLHGLAIDVGAIAAGRITWEIPPYTEIARAFQLASIELNIPVRWGAVWDRTLDSMSENMSAEIEAYRQRRHGKAFIDAGHFELHFSEKVTV